MYTMIKKHFQKVRHTNGFTLALILAIFVTVILASTFAHPFSVAAPQDLQPAPTDLTAQVGDNQVTLSWTASRENPLFPPVTEYVVVYGKAEIDSFRYETGSTDTTAVITDNVSNGTEFTFAVIARNESGDSAPSETITATPRVVYLPGRPSVEMINVQDAALEVMWNSPEEDRLHPITGYRVMWAGGGDEGVIDVELVNTYVITGLTNETEYTITVAAMNDDGVGPSSSEMMATPSNGDSSATPEAPTGLTATTGNGLLTLAWTAPSDGGSAITTYEISVTPLGGEEVVLSTESTDATYIANGLTNDLSYTVKVRAVNGVGAGLYSETTVGVPDDGSALDVVPSPVVEKGITSATISWATNKKSTTQVWYGLMTGSVATTEMNTVVRTRDHSVTITGLLSCTSYAYRVRSVDFFGSSVLSENGTFMTSGCEGDAQATIVARSEVSPVSGGEVSFVNEGLDTRLLIPENVVGDTSADIVIQAKHLEKDDVVVETGLPESKTWIADKVYKFTAYRDETEKIESFNSPVTVTIDYTVDDIAGITQSSLAIYHYRPESGWERLGNCSNTFNGSTGSISCDTASFSVFGLFGDESADSGSSSGSRPTSVALVDQVDGVQLPPPVIVEKNMKNVFHKNLWLGVYDEEVRLLQQFLNARGFFVATSGKGSVGNETFFFGRGTYTALKQFQSTYKESILIPLGLTFPTGYFGPATRAFIETQ